MLLILIGTVHTKLYKGFWQKPQQETAQLKLQIQVFALGGHLLVGIVLLMILIIISGLCCIRDTSKLRPITSLLSLPFLFYLRSVHVIHLFVFFVCIVKVCQYL